MKRKIIIKIMTAMRKFTTRGLFLIKCFIFTGHADFSNCKNFMYVLPNVSYTYNS